VSADQLRTIAYRTAVAGLALVLVVLLTVIAAGGSSHRRRAVLEIDYGTPMTPPAGTLPRSIP